MLLQPPEIVHVLSVTVEVNNVLHVNVVIRSCKIRLNQNILIVWHVLLVCFKILMIAILPHAKSVDLGSINRTHMHIVAFYVRVAGIKKMGSKHSGKLYLSL